MFCPTCQRRVTEEEWWALRMAYQSPAYSWTYLHDPSGVNLLWVRNGDAGMAYKDAAKAADILQWVEWDMIVEEIGRRVRRVILRGEAKIRLDRRRRRGW